VRLIHRLPTPEEKLEALKEEIETINKNISSFKVRIEYLKKLQTKFKEELSAKP